MSPRARSGRSTLLPALVLGAVLVLGAAHTAALHVMYDDAFISYRYAANLAHGQGLVYNAGERVEGYSNFLWTLLMSVVVLLGGRPETVGPWLSAAISLGTLAMVTVFAWRRGGYGWLAGAMLAASTCWATWGTGGLETALFGALVTGSALCLMRAAEPRAGAGENAARARAPAADPRWLNAAAVAAGLACLTRPDGPLVAGCEWLALVLLAARGRVRFADAWRFVAVVALFAVPHEAWRLAYYGRLVPNTYAVKPPGAARLAFGVRYLADAARDLGLWLLPVPLVLAALLRRRPRGLGAADAAVLALVLVPFAGYLATTGGDFMPVFRFVAPLVPLATLASAAALAALTGGGASRAVRALTIAAAVAIAGGYVAINVAQSVRQQGIWNEGELVSVGWARQEVDDWLRIGDLLAKIAEPTDTLATTAAGAVPYRSGLYTIDMLGLNAPDLSKFRRLANNRPGHMILLEEREVDGHPPQILLAHPLVHPTPRALALSYDLRPEWHDRVMSHYELVGLTLLGEPVRFVGCALRRDCTDRILEAGARARAEIDAAAGIRR